MQRLFQAFEAEGKELYLVGGAVRDFALGCPMTKLEDLDFCTNARPEESLAILKRHNFPTYDMGMEFGTVGAILRGSEEEGYPKDCQITTYRSAEYYRRGSRHPVVKFGDTIDQDLGRRDFSINSMAMDGEGNFIDPYGGLDDLQRGVMRVVGDPWETLAEDPLRILRIGRFVSRLGFSVDDELRQAAYDRAEHILDISHERWFQEMTKLLHGTHVATALQFLYDVRILGIILPEVASMVDFHKSCPVHHKDIWDHTLRVIEQASSSDAQKWAALLHDVGKVWTRRVSDDGNVTFYRHEQLSAMLFEGIARRFTFDNATAKEVKFIIYNHSRSSQFDPSWSDAAIRRFVRDMDPYVDAMLDFARADLTTRINEKRQQALERIEILTERIEQLASEDALRPQLPNGLGNALMQSFDLSPSPVVGGLKELLEHKIIEGELESGQHTQYYIDYLRANPPEILKKN